MCQKINRNSIEDLLKKVVSDYLWPGSTISGSIRIEHHISYILSPCSTGVVAVGLLWARLWLFGSNFHSTTIKNSHRLMWHVIWGFCTQQLTLFEQRTKNFLIETINTSSFWGIVFISILIFSQNYQNQCWTPPLYHFLW